MEVTKDIYTWLQQIKLIDQVLQVQDNGKVLIPEEISSEFESGVLFPAIIKRIHKLQNDLDREITPMPEINSLKDLKSPAAKLYNWKILVSALNLININLDPDTRALIVAGDRDMVANLLAELFEAEKNIKQKVDKKKKVVRKSIQKNKTGFNIDSIKPEKPLDQCETCLEFLLVSFCRHFSLRSKQAAGLLTQGGKYLTFVISKGLKGKHGPIVSWYSEIYSNLPTLLELLIQEITQGSIEIILSSLQSGFLSKNSDTVLWTCRIFAKLGSDLFEHELLPQAWDWFVCSSSGLESCLVSYSRFESQIQSQIINVLVQFGRNNFTELFTIQLRNSLPIPSDYLTTMDNFLQSLCEIRAAKSELLSAGILDYWVNLALQEAELEGPTKLPSSNFLCNIWMLFPSLYENNENLAGETLALLKKLWRDKSRVLKFSSVSKAFQLLDTFSVERNPYAPIIYKTLTFFLVENYREIETRELILYNFIDLFDKSPNIPIGILIDPLIKQYQVSNDINYNTVDFFFFSKMSKHERITVRQGLQMIDVLGKVYMSYESFTKASLNPFLFLAKRFIDHSSIQEYLFRLSKYTCKLATKTEQVNIKEAKPSKFQVSALLDLTTRVIKLSNDLLNERILAELCSANALFRRSSGGNSKSISTLMKLYGEPREIIENWLEKNPQPEASETITEAEASSIKETPRKSPRKAPRAESSSTSLHSYNILPKNRADLDLQRIRQNYLEKELSLQLEKEKELNSLEAKKRNLRKQLERKRIETSSSFASSSKPTTAKIEGFSLFELSAQERELVSILMKRYQRPLKLLFKKYSSTGYSNSVIDKATFETFAEKNSVISDSEMYKLLKEQGVHGSMISLEEFSAIMKNFCHKSKKSAIRANFNEFQELLIQTALFIHSKPAHDLSHLSPVISVKRLFDIFRKSVGSKGIGAKFYDEPDPGVGDREVVKRLNLMLEKDPNSELPEGYKKVVENDIEIRHEVPQFDGVSESQMIGVAVLDGLMEKLFGVHILEPIIVVKSVTRARGVLSKPTIVPEHDLSLSLGSKFNISAIGTTYHKAVYQPSLPTELNLTPGIKFEIARLTGKYSQEVLYESAKLLDDILHSVDSKSPNLISRNNKAKIVNKALQLKEQDSQIKKLEEEKKEAKRKLRSQVIESKLKKAQELKSEKEKLEKEKKKSDEEKRKDNLRKLEEKRKEELIKKEIELGEWKERKKEELEKLKNEENQKKNLADEEKRKKLEDFKARQKIQTLEKILEPKVQEPEKKPPKPNLERILKKDKQKIEEQKKQEEKIQTSLNSPEIQEVLAVYSKSLEALFTHFSKTSNSDSLPQSGFTRFCSMFNITSVLLPAEEILKVFRQVTKTKNSQTLDIQQFKESCFRLAIYSREELEKIDKCGYLEELPAFNRFLQYLQISPQVKVTRDLLQELETMNNKAHPRDKKSFKIARSMSRDKTPADVRIRPLSTRRK